MTITPTPDTEHWTDIALIPLYLLIGLWLAWRGREKR